MSDIRKWLKIMESVPDTLLNQPQKNVIIKKDATVTLSPNVGGGVGRYIHSTDSGAMIDIKGIVKELTADDFSLPPQDYEDPYVNGNSQFHATVTSNTLGTLNDKPEFRSGDIVKVEDVYGTAIGPGFGVFIAYGTSGQDCIVSFDNKEIIVPTSNLSSVQEQDAKNNFNQTDNDGNLSPMSLGSNNIKVEKEPAMGQKDEFSKWIAAVEGALFSNTPVDTDLSSDAGTCGCNSWNCPACFPDDDLSAGPEAAVVVGGETLSTACPTCGHDGEHDFTTCELSAGVNDIEADEYNLEEVSIGEEEMEFEQPETGRSGKGVKLGDIITKTEFRKTGGQNSPMTYGEENLDEEDPNGMEVEQPLIGEVDDMSAEEGDTDPMDMISTITYMQDMGLSNASTAYSKDQMASMSIEQLKQIYNEVTGEVAEAVSGPKPTKTHQYDPFADMDDILSPRSADLPANVQQDKSTHAGSNSQNSNMSLPAASRATTQSKLRNMTPSDTMRDFMNRINPEAGAGEPELQDTMSDEVVLRTANDVPAVISSAMQATGTQSPEWHNVNNLPGFRDRNIRGMGRQVFSMFTSTPLEKIQTIANVGGQGPNTDAEMRAVGSWLMQNAEDLGEVDVSHGMAIPGYKPDVKEYRLNGVRFHVVRDPMGQYIYAYPDTDARLNGKQSDAAIGMDRPQLSEDAVVLKPTLFEQLKWDEEIAEALNSFVEDIELDESTLSKEIAWYPGPAGKQKKKQGGWNLLNMLHKKYKFSNEASMEKLPFNRNVAYGYFKNDPDHFIIVQGEDGVAAIRPSEEYINYMKNRPVKRGQRPYHIDPNQEKNDPKLQYQVIAFKNDGLALDPALFRDVEADEKSKNDDEEFQTTDPSVRRLRMGSFHGKDNQSTYNVFELLAAEIGRLTSMWMSGFSAMRADTAKGFERDVKPHTGSIEREKIKKRAELKAPKSAESEEVLVDKVFKRVRPVLKTLANQSIGHINNRARRYVDGGNYEAAAKIAKSGEKLKQFLATIDTSGDVNLGSNYEFARHIRNAISVAADAPVGSAEYKDFLKNAAEGNAIALKPILDALRDTLVALS